MGKNSNNSPGQIQYRVLALDEWKLFPAIFESIRERGGAMPNPAYSAIAVAYIEGQGIVGYLITNLTLHVEPLMVNSPHAINGLFDCTDAYLLKRFGDGVKYFSMVPGGGVEEKIALHRGMNDLGLKTFQKVLRSSPENETGVGVEPASDSNRIKLVTH